MMTNEEVDYFVAVMKWRKNLSNEVCASLHADYNRGSREADVIDGHLEFMKRRAEGRIRKQHGDPRVKLAKRCERHIEGRPGSCRECRKLNELPEMVFVIPDRSKPRAG